MDKPLRAETLVAQRRDRGWGAHELAVQIRREALRAGRDVPALAALTRYIRRWERGVVPSQPYQLLLTRALGADDAERLTAIAAGRAAPDSAVADSLGTLTHYLRLRDDTAPSGSLVGAARDLAGVTRRMLAAAEPREQKAIGRVAAEIATVRWWLATDAGEMDSAQVLHDQAVRLAVEWQVPALVAHLLAWRTGEAIRAGDYQTAARLAHQAQEPRWAATPAGNAWAATYEARALLAAGDRDGMLRAVDAAQAAYADVRPDAEPRWLYHQSGPSRLLDHLDTQLMAKGPEAAGGDVVRALGELPAANIRDHAWYWARLGLAWVRAGGIDQAAAHAAHAAALAESIGSAWPLAELIPAAREPGRRVLAEALADHGVTV